MKKQAKAPTQGKPPVATTTASKVPSDKSNTDLPASSPTTPTAKKSATSTDKSDKAIGKKHLSKSQDNLASALRRKAAVAALSLIKDSQIKDSPATPFSKSQDNLASTLRRKAAAQSQVKDSTSTTPRTESRNGGNKENLIVKDRPNSGALKVPKPIKHLGNPIRKAHSTQNIEKTENPIRRASSVQTVNVQKNPGPANSPVKKAASTQNISKGPKGSPRQRISAPANIMAYNAELLASFEKEKKSLERRISELIQIAETRKTEIEKCKFEIRNLKENLPSSEVQEELEVLRSMNRLLKDRLNELGVPVEQITDNEKLSMRQHAANSITSDDGQMQSEESSGGGAIAMLPNQTGPELTLSMGDLSCITPDHPSLLSLDNSNWDKQSTRSSDAMSEVSLACLQDRIQQMEETHYSTNEELQATLQELTDLQDAVNDLTCENERLADERSVLLESLCAQTEKLENARMQIDHLKALLVSESDSGDRSENERQLVCLVKSAQEEKDEFLLRQVELSNTLGSAENENRELQDIISAMRDKIHLLELKNDTILEDKQNLEKQSRDLKDITANDTVEIQRIKNQLDVEKSKVTELQQYHNAGDKSDIGELLEAARQEKDKIAEKLTSAQEELAQNLCEMTKLNETITSLEEEIKITQDNAKSDIADLVDKEEKLESEKMNLGQEVDSLRDHIDQLEQDCDRYLEEKKSYSTSLGDLQLELTTTKARNMEMDMELKELRAKFHEESSEWRQLQMDLQTAVVIANDIKSETQTDMKKFIDNNSSLKEANLNLKAETDALRNELERWKTQQEAKARNDLRGRVMSTVDKELAALRQGRKLSVIDNRSGQQSKDIASVKTLIASIEQQVKTSVPCSPTLTTAPLSPTIPSSPGSSRRSSVDSTFSSLSVKSDIVKIPTDTHAEKQRNSIGHRHTITNIMHLDKAQQPVSDDVKSSPSSCGGRSEVDGGKKSPAVTSILSNKNSNRRNSVTDYDKGNKDPLAALVKSTGGSKRNALLKWCQNKSQNYANIDITNFSSSWNDGLAFCAIMHSYVPQMIPFSELNAQDKKRNFTLAFSAAKKVGIDSILHVNDMVAMERPDWQAVMACITNIYKHFEIDMKQQ